MVVGAFPAAKLGALLLKQISKPIANMVKTQAKSSPVFRKYVCMPPAQFYNWCEVKSKMWILNLGKPVNIPVLNEAMAIELGANLLGEGIIFIIAAGILISEYSRSARKETAKEEAKKQEMIQLQNTIKELFIQTEEQGAHVRELTRKMVDLENKLGPKLPESKPTSPILQDSEKKPITLADLRQNSVRHKEPIFHQKRTTTRIYDNIILKAVNDIEDQFWSYELAERENSLLILSIYYIQELFRFKK